MRYLILTFILLFNINFSARSQAEIEKFVNELNGVLQEVEHSKKTYFQEFSFIEYSVVAYTQETVDLKGNKERLTYEFNLADIDENVVREKTIKDLIVVGIKANSRQKFIKLSVNDEPKSYIEEFQIVANDIENARNIRELVENSIPVAEDIMKSKLSLNTLDEMNEWLQTNISDVDLGTKLMRQTISTITEYPGYFEFTQVEEGGKTVKESKYYFNIADINPHSLKFNISGSQFQLLLETNRRQKFVKSLKDNINQPFASKISVFMNNVENGRDVREVLLMAIPQAKDALEESLPQIADHQQGFNQLSSLLGEVELDSKSYQQELSGECIATYNQQEITSRGTEEYSYVFNTIDLNANQLDVEVRGKELLIGLSVENSDKLVEFFKNGDKQNYIDKLSVRSPDVENARRLVHVLKQQIELCKGSYVSEVPTTGNAEKIQWLSSAVGEVNLGEESVDQKLELVNADDTDKVKLTILEIGSKTSVEKIYEFNFSDLDARNISYNISGKNISIGLSTKYKNKIIKFYKDGEIQNYQYEFSIQVDDIESGRNIQKAFKEIIASFD